MRAKSVVRSLSCASEAGYIHLLQLIKDKLLYINTMSESLLSYAALVLTDSEKEINADSLQAVLDAAGASVDRIWVETFAKALNGQDFKDDLLKSSSNVSAAPAAAASGPAAASGDDADEEKKEESEEEEEAADADLGMG